MTRDPHSFARGIVYALPLSLALWAFIAVIWGWL